MQNTIVIGHNELGKRSYFYELGMIINFLKAGEVEARAVGRNISKLESICSVLKLVVENIETSATWENDSKIEGNIWVVKLWLKKK